MKGERAVANPVRLHDYLFSGNGYKIRLALRQLNLKVEHRYYDLTRGETYSQDFLQKNPMAQIPVLELSDGTLLRESNAILYWLTEGSALLPADKLLHTRALEWMFFEQSSVDRVLGRARFLSTFPAFMEFFPDGTLEFLQEQGRKSLGVLEQELKHKPFLLGDHYSAADIALYAYTHCADEGGIAMGDYPCLRAWFARVAAQPGYLAIDEHP